MPDSRFVPLRAPRRLFAYARALPAAIVLTVVAGGFGHRTSAPAPDTILAITHVTVIDGTTPAPRADWTVIVRDGRVSEAGPAASVRVPTGATVVMGRGRYLIPGLWDMHVHVGTAAARVLPQYVAAGVTQIRELGSMPMARIDSVHRLEDDGRLLGPRIVGAGFMVETPRSLQFFADLARRSEAEGRPQPNWREGHLAAATPAEAEAVVDTVARSGSRILKVIDAVDAPTYFALARAARERGLLFDGHLLFPRLTTLAQAVDSGQRGFEHLYNLSFGLDPLSDSARAALYARMRAERVAFIPTLFTTHWDQVPTDSVMALAADSLGILDPRNRFVGSEERASWIGRVATARDPRRAIAPERVQLMWTRGLARLREMHRAGIYILPGTDLGGYLVYPGTSLHEELALLAHEVGMTPYEVLLSATLLPARFMGMTDSLGTVASGKLANLVLLDRDPLARVENLAAVESVVLRGRLVRRAELDSAAYAARAEGIAASQRR